jgi:tetratricopeptide (TPR) repeat protein
LTRPPCPTIAELTALVAGEGMVGIASHVDSCERCMRLVELARQAVKAQIGNAVLADSARKIELLVDSLLELPPEERLRAAAGDEYMRAGVARRLSERALEAWDTDLNVALEYIHAATVIADRMAVRSGRVAELEFEVWKNRSTIHRERGETDAARACLSKAGAAIERCEDRELKRAIVWYADAAICASRDVWEPRQALELLARAERVFLIRDAERRRDVRTLRGIVHLHGGEYPAAVEDFAAVLAATDLRAEAPLADARRNLANALVRVGQADEAERILLQARAFDRRASRELHVIRDDALLAIIAEAREEFETAARGYADTQRRFTAAGEHESALIAGKNLAMTLVAMNRLTEAAVVLRDLLARSVASGDDRRRFTADALAYLRDLAQRYQLTLDVASPVSRYIDRIHVQRAVPFTPPMSLFTM